MRRVCVSMNNSISMPLRRHVLVITEFGLKCLFTYDVLSIHVFAVRIFYTHSLGSYNNSSHSNVGTTRHNPTFPESRPLVRGAPWIVLAYLLYRRGLMKLIIFLYSLI